MRVPISLADLRDKRGFNRIAKKLQRKWPIPGNLTLSTAHEIASRGLGYRDFHDLQQSAGKNELGDHIPNAIDVRASLTASIFAFCKIGEVTGVSETDFDRIVASLPLQELAIFQHLNERPDPKLKRISTKQLVSLGELVQMGGSLRDRCLFMMLVIGRMNLNEIVERKARDITVSESIVRVELAGRELTGQPKYVFLPDHTWPLLAEYVDQKDLSPDDYLFPSKKDKTVPMSSREMNKLICSYLRHVLPDPSYWTAHRFRQSLHCYFNELLYQPTHIESWSTRAQLVSTQV